MTSIDFLKEIRKHQSGCVGLLQRFKAANLTSEDVANAKSICGSSLLHFVMRFCTGEGVLGLVKHLVELHPEGVTTQNEKGYLPIHVLPSRVGLVGLGIQTTKASIQHDQLEAHHDQLEARLFLMTKYTEGLKVKDENGYTPLVRAIRFQYNEIVKVIVDQFPEQVKEYCCSETGKIPLDHAMEVWNHNAVKMLIVACPEYATKSQVPLQSLISVGKCVNLTEQMEMIGTIAEVLPQAFDFSCDCNEDDFSCAGKLSTCKLATHAVPQFLKATQMIPIWKQSVVRCLLKHSTTRRRTDMGTNTAANSTAVLSPYFEKKLLDLELQMKSTSLQLEHTEMEMLAAKAELETAQQQREKDKQLLAKEQTIKLKDTNDQMSNDSLILKLDCTWSAQELMGVLELLMHRYKNSKDSSNFEPQHSVVCIAASYVAKEENPPKIRLLRTIEAMNKELLEMATFGYASETELESSSISRSPTDTSEPMAVHNDESRKRARLSPCPVVL
jgi:hypothetical protein